MQGAPTRDVRERRSEINADEVMFWCKIPSSGPPVIVCLWAVTWRAVRGGKRREEREGGDIGDVGDVGIAGIAGEEEWKGGGGHVLAKTTQSIAYLYYKYVMSGGVC